MEKTKEKGNFIHKLRPACMDYFWGGNRLKEMFFKESGADCIAETWEVSVRKDNESVICEGEYAGLTLGEYIKKRGNEILGENAKRFDRFPILVKLIDANEPLSIQIHPPDEYALAVENEYGKNEMWYVAAAKEGAYIYYGLKSNISKDELRRHISEHTLPEVLNKVNVKKGDVFFVHAGMLHAIGDGIIMCEIQQNSNATYRIDDYNRTAGNGQCRELNVEKAIEVADIELNVKKAREGQVKGRRLSDGAVRLADNRYFVTDLYRGSEDVTIEVDDSSFAAVVILEGEGQIVGESNEESYDFKPGTTFFIDAGAGACQVRGSGEFIVVRV